MGLVASLAGGVVVGAVEVVLALSFAALVFGGYLSFFLADGIGLYLVAAALTGVAFALLGTFRQGVVVAEGGNGSATVLAGLPPRLWNYFERVSLTEGTRLISQDDAPDDVYVLESGRLQVELVTPEGTQMRLSTVLPA